MPRTGRPRLAHPRVPITAYVLPEDLARWKASGRGWRHQMALCLEREAPKTPPSSRKARVEAQAARHRLPPGVAPAGYRLVCGDSRSTAPPAFDALITDPPYGIRYISHHREGRDRTSAWGRHIHGASFPPIEGDDKAFDPTYWIRLVGSRPCVLWGANYYADKLPTTGGWLLWNKRGNQSPNKQADAEMAWTNILSRPRVFSHLWRGVCREGEENVSCCGRKLHPNQKPVALMDWILGQCRIQPGMTVFDPFAGSGSLGVACLRRGIHYLGIEIDPRYYAVACKRLAAETASLVPAHA